MGKKRYLSTKWLIALGLFLVLVLVSSPIFTIPRPKMKVGDIVPRAIRASQDLEVIKTAETLKRQEAAVKKKRPVYDFNTKLIGELENKIGLIFERAKRIKEEKLPLEGKLLRLKKELGLELSEKVLITLLSYSKPDRLETQTKALLRTMMQTKIVDDPKLLATKIEKGIKVRTTSGEEILLLNRDGIYTLPQARKLLEDSCLELFPDNRFLRQASSEITTLLLLPNFRYNDKETKKRQERAREETGAAILLIKKGQKIVEEGYPVNEEQLVALETLWQKTTKRSFLIIIGRALVILVLMTGLGFHLHRYQGWILEDNILLVVFGLIAIIAVFLIKALTFVPGLNSYFIPVAFATILIAIILGGRLAILTGVALAILAGLLTGYGLPFVIVALVGGATGAYSVRWVKHRIDFLKAGVFIALANCLLILAFLLLGIESNPNSLWWGLGNGFASCLLAFLLLPVFEHGFKVTTDIRLLELSNLNHPLLKKLANQIPGTYHHSIIVGNLAEAAATAVGANYLLARVASYYHDIGKIKNGDYFIENRIKPSREYKKLIPRLSSQIIISHVREGAELARESRITPRIIDIITQHHGTSLIAQFYRKALQVKKEEVNEEDYRYPGPRPRTKEAAVVMLADSIEAASRVLTKPSPEKIEALVKEIINKKFTDSQLDECPLTLSDLKKIVEVFTRALTGMTHGRIDYPLTRRIKKRKYGNTNKEPGAKKKSQTLFSEKNHKKNA
jgi:putative nucleotidyltransferase with HDIG domain